MIKLSNGREFEDVVIGGYCRSWIAASLATIGQLIPPGAPLVSRTFVSDGFESCFEIIERQVRQTATGLIVALEGNYAQLNFMVQRLTGLPLVAIELKVLHTCTGRAARVAEMVKAITALHELKSHPLILNLASPESRVEIARELQGIAAAINFYNRCKLDTSYQKQDWPAVGDLVRAVPEMPVIVPDLQDWRDIAVAQTYGGKNSARSWGRVYRYTPSGPYRWVKRWRRQEEWRRLYRPTCGVAGTVLDIISPNPLR